MQKLNKYERFAFGDPITIYVDYYKNKSNKSVNYMSRWENVFFVKHENLLLYFNYNQNDTIIQAMNSCYIAPIETERKWYSSFWIRSIKERK